MKKNFFEKKISKCKLLITLTITKTAKLAPFTTVTSFRSGIRR